MNRSGLNRHILALAATLCSVLALGACSSARFGNLGPAQAIAAAPVPMPEPVEAVPSGPVVSEPLPPLPGDVVAGGNPNIAALPPQPAMPSPSAVPAPSGRSTLIGTWSARDASGQSCRVQLSSTPALDLYRANAAGCANKDLAKVNAWDYRDGEVFLYQSGGTVAARLRGSSGSLTGVLARSGAPLTLAR